METLSSGSLEKLQADVCGCRWRLVVALSLNLKVEALTASADSLEVEVMTQLSD